jgi:hypothetical protein
MRYAALGLLVLLGLVAVGLLVWLVPRALYMARSRSGL